MPTLKPHPLVRYVRALAASPGATSLSDAELLERFAHQGDETAFATLVGRHGLLVLAACRRVLGHWHDAEDAFQATFVVLARRAGSLRLRALSPWLHEVATRTALKARTQAFRRRAYERMAAPRSEGPSEEAVWRDLRPLLDEAVGRLPEKYRIPVVLCYIEGRTVAEVARQLGCPRGTVAARLARGRERLRAGLVRRGVVLSAAALVVGMKGAASARVPGPLAATAIRAGASTLAGRAAGDGLLSARVAALVKGVNRAMLMKRMRTAALWLLGTALIGGGIGLSVVATRVAAQPIPRAEANGLPQVEGNSSGGESRPPASNQEPPSAGTPRKVYMIAIKMIEPAPDGEDLGPLGKGRVVASPTLGVLDGEEGRFYSGKQITVPGDKGVPAGFFEGGTALRVKVRSLSDGRVRLDAVWEQGGRALGSKDQMQVCGTVVRAFARMKLGQAIKLTDKDEDGKVRHLAWVKVATEETVISKTRSAASAPKDIQMDVQETRTGSVLPGLGINSDAGLTGSVILNERNFEVKPAAPGTDNHPKDHTFRGAGQEVRLLNSLEYQVPVRANDKLYHVGFVDSGTVDQPPPTKKAPAPPDSDTRLVIPALGPVPVSIDFGFPVRKK